MFPVGVHNTTQGGHIMNRSSALFLDERRIEDTEAVAGHGVEVIVHIRDALGEARRQDLKVVLEQVPGVRSAAFSANRNHLLLVSYDRHITSSFNILDSVRHQRVNAKLVGPI